MEDDSQTANHPPCIQCFRRPPIRHHMTVLLPLIMLITSAYTMCPTKCSCNDENLNASCSFASLQVVPIQLNPELKYVNLSHNKINSVHFTLEIYGNLIELDLSNNKIQKLGSMNFISQVHLEKLFLNNNELENLDKDVFKGLKSLKKIDLSNNQIEEINENSLNDLQLLEILILNNNKLVSFESNLLKHQKNLLILQLDNNDLLEIPAENLEHTLNLEKLSISQNLIENIEENSLPNLKHLKILNLDKNLISEIHGNIFDGFTELSSLNLAENNLTEIPTVQLSKLSNLNELNLSGNFFSTIPPVSFRGLFKLQKLYLNGIETLIKIDIRSFVDNINLEFVSMNDNIELENIPTRLFHGNPKLIHISIKNNMLQSLEATHFPLDQLGTLHIGENPLECNCSLIWLWKLVTEQKSLENINKTTQDMLLDIEEIICAGPEKLKNILLVDLPEYEIRCSLNWIAVATGTTTALFVLIIALIALVYSGVLRKLRTNEQRQEPTNSDRQRSRDKCEHMIGPPLLSEYQTLPWDYSGNKDADMYRQFGYHSNHSHGSRPHIVYV